MCGRFNQQPCTALLPYSRCNVFVHEKRQVIAQALFYVGPCMQCCTGKLVAHHRLPEVSRVEATQSGASCTGDDTLHTRQVSHKTAADLLEAQGGVGGLQHEQTIIASGTLPRSLPPLCLLWAEAALAAKGG